MKMTSPAAVGACAGSAAAVVLPLFLAVLPGTALGHDPVFGLGPHTLFKGGVEVHIGLDRTQGGTQQETEGRLELAYGLTGDWSLRAELPYVDRDHGTSGLADVALATKYRFWRHDRLGVQETAAVLGKFKLDSAGRARGTDSTDTIVGLAYGYESRRWYRWAALRYRFNGETPARLDRGDKVLLDLVGGIRFRPSSYLEPDWVWMVELNGERSARDRLQGRTVRDSGGSQWFLSPGVMWTLRNFAIKGGVQFAVASRLHGDQADSDYRARLELEWHL
ncbi:MAG TPA: hypothetical protein ENK48_02060 [Gammaproteobacteria bacterium]|nr:hypothetical protein [Gammaproteobacteria bacterium]